ncbi:MAG TPA: pyridoxamine 5'-phosphate oxidase family protein [Acidimicrobiia bacterium]|nr:pyridoxamine 5'-phosphate oxidase family protein [Acidimicrobiia bacterium]
MESLTREEALEVLASEPVAHLGVVEDGSPYVTPMSFVVVENRRILFRTMAGRKLEGLRANPSVCVEVSRFDAETGDWVSVIVTGKARLVEEPDLRQEIVARLFDKYQHVMGSPLAGSTGLLPLGAEPYVIEVPIDSISGMSSGRGIGHLRTKPGRL